MKFVNAGMSGALRLIVGMSPGWQAWQNIRRQLGDFPEGYWQSIHVMKAMAALLPATICRIPVVGVDQDINGYAHFSKDPPPSQA